MPTLSQPTGVNASSPYNPYQNVPQGTSRWNNGPGIIDPYNRGFNSNTAHLFNPAQPGNNAQSNRMFNPATNPNTWSQTTSQASGIAYQPTVGYGVNQATAYARPGQTSSVYDMTRTGMGGQSEMQRGLIAAYQPPARVAQMAAFHPSQSQSMMRF